MSRMGCRLITSLADGEADGSSRRDGARCGGTPPKEDNAREELQNQDSQIEARTLVLI